jgi:hypothetical protein
MAMLRQRSNSLVPRQPIGQFIGSELYIDYTTWFRLTAARSARASAAN